jgi:adenylate kinase family enzyme
MNLQYSIVLITSKRTDRNDIGTGFVIHQDESASYIVTCAHVVNTITKENVRVREKDATVIAYGWESGKDSLDLAVIRVEGLILPPLKLQTNAIKQDSFSTQGYFYFDQQITIKIAEVQGILKQEDTLSIKQGKDFIKGWELEITSEKLLQAGYSGSPILNQQQEVIGVVTHELDNGRKGAAISIDALAKVWLEMPSELSNILNLSSSSIKTELFEPSNNENHRCQIAQTLEIDNLVTLARQAVSEDIKNQCGYIRVLDMVHPIGLNDLYTHVNILKKITGRRNLKIAQLLEMNPVGKRVPGLVAVEQYRKLMILGKPGAGKTTFLKKIAIQCNSGQFLTDYIPIFITLKNFAEETHHPNLFDYINRQLFIINNTLDTQIVQTLLDQGRAIVLLDGLDEVKEEDSSRIIKQIEEFTHQYSTNHFITTCRLAAQEYTFEQFTEVEIADFDYEQIETFVTNWFLLKNEPEQPERFIQELQSNKQIKELATNPLLLTLLCLEFEESGEFPPDRSELYNRAIQTLLRRWDKKRGIRRDEVYKKLSTRHKEYLISDIAYKSFERGEYFFKKKYVQLYIFDYIHNSSLATTESEVDTEAILKSIEAQHGLLLEQSRGIYSFSHLTFQEYFTAFYIIQVKQSSNESSVFEVLRIGSGCSPES